MITWELVLAGVALLFGWFVAVVAHSRRRARLLESLFEDMLGDIARLGTIAGEPRLENKIRRYRERYHESIH